METIEESNNKLYKEQASYRKMAIRQMIISFVRSCPKEILLDVLQERKIIKRDWGKKKGIKFIENKKI